MTGEVEVGALVVAAAVREDSRSPSLSRGSRAPEPSEGSDPTPVSGLEGLPVRSDPLVKRLLDLVLALAGLLLSAPLWPTIALAIRLDDGGPVFFRHCRVGRGGRPFTAWKFRSMVPDSPEAPGTGPADPSHVTRVGEWLRVTGLDELPQLWNVLRGDMSLVGPRPLLLEQVEADDPDAPDLQEEPGFRERHTVRPGLTGLAQLRAPSRFTFRRQFRYDALYARSRTVCLDIQLIALSVRRSLRGGWGRRRDGL